MNSYSVYIPVYYPTIEDEEDKEFVEDVDDFIKALKEKEFDIGWTILNFKVSLIEGLSEKLLENVLLQDYLKRLVEKHWIEISFRVENEKHISGPAWSLWNDIRFCQMATVIARPNFHLTTEVFYAVDGEFVEKLRGINTNISEAIHMHGSYRSSWPYIERLDINKTWAWASQFPAFFVNLSTSRIERALCAYSQLFHAHHNLESTVSDFFWSMIALESIFTDGTESVQKNLFEKMFLILGKPKDYEKKIKEIYQKRSRLLHGQLNIPNKFSFESNDESIDKHMELIDSEESSVCLLIATLQYLVKNNLKDISFTKTYQISASST